MSECEVAENAFRQAGDVFQEHCLALAVGANHRVMKGQGKLNDGIKPGKRSVARPHFLDHDAGMAGAENMNHSPGKNGFAEPLRGLLD